MGYSLGRGGEMFKLAEAAGGQRDSLAGLAGIGDSLDPVRLQYVSART
jgi:hypothetical protein